MLAFHTLYWIFLPRCYFLQKTMHRMFLEHWNRQKILSNIRQRFSCLLSEWIAKKCKNIFFRVLRCTWTGRINLKICLGYDINYLSIWPFMRHPWFPSRKASKLTFVCFQLQLFSTTLVIGKWNIFFFFRSGSNFGILPNFF